MIFSSKMRQRLVKDGYVFHPWEIAFTGLSELGKTRLIEAVTRQMSKNFSIAYIKHDGCGHTLTASEKDTDKIRSAGAAMSFISNDHEFQVAGTAHLNLNTIRTIVSDFDLCFIEGYKSLPTRKQIDLSPSELDTDKVLDAIEEDLKHLENSRPLYGLVLSGGQSRRMGQDKGLLEYHGEPQAKHLYNLLEGLCDQVFLSSRHQQYELTPLAQLKQITDQFIEMGPIGGILSAMNEYPDAAWLVVACDLPRLDSATLKNLMTQRKAAKMATAFKSIESDLPEPLCAIYEPKARIKLFQALGAMNRCPRRVLLENSVHLIDQDSSIPLYNANHPEDYALFKTKLHAGEHP